jgi:hypothetical protein
MSEQPPKSPRLPGKPAVDGDTIIRASMQTTRENLLRGLLESTKEKMLAQAEIEALKMVGLDEEQRWRAVKVCVAKGDKAKQRAQDFYITAGQHLNALKAQLDKAGGKWAEWEVLLKKKAGIAKSRASELMAIADGTKTVEQVRAQGAERKAKHLEKAKEISPFRNGENTSDPAAKKAIQVHFETTPVTSAPVPVTVKVVEPKQAKADRMPTEAEGEESYQKTLYDQACLFLEQMSDATRQRFFGFVREKYRLNAVWKPRPEWYDPKHKVRGTPSINRLYKPCNLPMVGDRPTPQDIGNEHINDFYALDDADEHVIDYCSEMEEAFGNARTAAPVENAPPPNVSADKMKAAFAKIAEDEAALMGWDANEQVT